MKRIGGYPDGKRRLRLFLFLTPLLLCFPAMAGEKRLAAPTITPTGGQYSLNAVVRVAIRSEPGTVVVYTLDGTNPAWNRGTMADANTVSFDLPPGDVVVLAAAFRPGFPRGPVCEAKFTRTGE